MHTDMIISPDMIIYLDMIITPIGSIAYVIDHDRDDGIDHIDRPAGYMALKLLA